jgi:hypothetical protein
MKNIHILPTDKPSRLYFNNNDNCFQLCEVSKKSTPLKINQNIYITNLEEIEVDWVIGTEGIWKNTIAKTTGTPITDIWEKIILTDDKKLIADGVQELPEDFYSWFIENQDCEYIEVVKYEDNKSPILIKDKTYHYKITIPQEEPKKCVFCNMYPQLKNTDKCESCYSVIRHFLEQDPMFKDKLLPDIRSEQETVEEVDDTELYETINKFINGGKDLQKGATVSRAEAVDYAFTIALKVAKCQAEHLLSLEKEDLIKTDNDRLLYQIGVLQGLNKKVKGMYNDDEVKNILECYLHYLTTDSNLDADEWFENYKKK